MHVDEKKSYKEIIKLADIPISSSAFSRVVKREGWISRGRIRKYSVNETFFSEELNSTSAWILGWMMTDGYINEKQFDLTVQSGDIDVLNKIKSAINFDGDLYIRDSKCTLRVYNRNFINHVFDLGFPRTNKTFTANYLEIPPHLDKHFIRGLFEGDGSISISKGDLKVCICGASQQLINSVNEKLSEQGIRTRLYTRDGNFYSLHAKTHLDAALWMRYMYEDSTYETRLNRKFDKYMHLLATAFDIQRKSELFISEVKEARKIFSIAA